MKTKDLKLFALEYINLQESVSKDDRLELMDFVQEATKEEVMSLLFTGIPRSLEEGEDKFVTDLFEMTFGAQIPVLTEAIFTEAPADWQGDTLLNMGKALLKKAGIAANDATPDMVKNAAAVAKKMGKTAYDMDKAALKKAIVASKGQGSFAGASAFSAKAHGAKAMGDSGAIKALASKWASYKVPNAKEVPSWLGGGAVGKGETAVTWGKNYNQAIEALNKGVPVAAAVVTALVVLLARKAYKAYLTKAARACKGAKGQEKNDCIKKFKVDAVKAQIQALGGGKAACKSAKNPEQCAAKIDNKIKKKQFEIQKMMSMKKVR